MRRRFILSTCCLALTAVAATRPATASAAALDICPTPEVSFCVDPYYGGCPSDIENFCDFLVHPRTSCAFNSGTSFCDDAPQAECQYDCANTDHPDDCPYGEFYDGAFGICYYDNVGPA